jgi:hypothetical protein
MKQGLRALLDCSTALGNLGSLEIALSRHHVAVVGKRIGSILKLLPSKVGADADCRPGKIHQLLSHLF